jgi:hypothetical protein
VPERAQLFQRLGLLDCDRRVPRVRPEEPGAVRVDAEVTEDRQPRRQRRTRRQPARERLARVRDRRAAEVERVAGVVAHHLDRVRVEELGGVVDRDARGRDRRRGALGERMREAADEIGRDQRLVALDVDDQLVVGQGERLGRLREAVGARGMVGAGHDGIAAVRARRGGDALVVGRDPHRGRAALPRALGDAHHHRLAGDVGERLARQPARRVARGNEDGEAEQPRHRRRA